jgi:hypothetical protein
MESAAPREVRNAADFARVHGDVSRQPARRAGNVACLLDCSTSPEISRACAREHGGDRSHAARLLHTDGFALSAHFERHGGALIDPRTREVRAPPRTRESHTSSDE